MISVDDALYRWIMATISLLHSIFLCLGDEMREWKKDEEINRRDERKKAWKKAIFGWDNNKMYWIEREFVTNSRNCRIKQQMDHRRMSGKDRKNEKKGPKKHSLKIIPRTHIIFCYLICCKTIRCSLGLASIHNTVAFEIALFPYKIRITDDFDIFFSCFTKIRRTFESKEYKSNGIMVKTASQGEFSHWNDENMLKLPWNPMNLKYHFWWKKIKIVFWKAKQLMEMNIIVSNSKMEFEYTNASNITPRTEVMSRHLMAFIFDIWYRRHSAPIAMVRLLRF